MAKNDPGYYSDTGAEQGSENRVSIVNSVKNSEQGHEELQITMIRGRCVKTQTIQNPVVLLLKPPSTVWKLSKSLVSSHNLTSCYFKGTGKNIGNMNSTTACPFRQLS